MKEFTYTIKDEQGIHARPASILAKVTRDRLMVEYDKVMPEYGFAGHKGYGSKEHIEAIKKYGPTPIHRKTLIPFEQGFVMSFYFQGYRKSCQWQLFLNTKVRRIRRGESGG